MSDVLGDISKNSLVKVTGFSGGDAMKRRLKDLGILVNEVIKIVKNDNHGPVIVNVKGADIVLGRTVTEKIIVESLDD